ncbi:MAG: J domain-containing protein, partial [Nitrospinaceae bacterium]|nr:J domain-containing protein [Nitrospinaceae bacterium]
QLHVTFSQAALGAEVDVKTLYGESKLKVPRGVQPGDLLRLRGEGFPVPGRKAKGDHVVQILVRTPTKLSSKAEKLFKELASLEVGGTHKSGTEKMGFSGYIQSLAEGVRRFFKRFGGKLLPAG